MIEQDDTELNLLSLLRDASFALFVEQYLPGLHAHLYVQRQSPSTPIVQGRRIFLPSHAMLTCTPRSGANPSWHIEVRGSVRLWSRISEIHDIWKQEEKPDVSRYRITIEKERHYIQLPSSLP